MKAGISKLINPYYARFNDGIMTVIGAVIGGSILDVYGVLIGGIIGYFSVLTFCMFIPRKTWDVTANDLHNAIKNLYGRKHGRSFLSANLKIDKYKFRIGWNPDQHSTYGITTNKFLFITLNQFLWGKIEDNDIFQKFLRTYPDHRIEDWTSSLFGLCIIIEENNVQACYDFVKCFVDYTGLSFSDIKITSFFSNVPLWATFEENEQSVYGIQPFNFYGRLLDSPVYMHKGKFFILWKGENLRFNEFPKWWHGEELNWSEIFDKRLAETQEQ